MAFTYSIYGLHLRSNLPIPGLVVDESGIRTDVEISLGSLHASATDQYTRSYESPYLYENGEPYLIFRKSDDGQLFHFRYGDGTEFLVDRLGTRVSGTWPDELNLENTVVYLVGQIAAFILRLRGLVCLHASAVVIDGRVLAIAGEPGAGKSTTAACFAQLGYPVLSEDVSALFETADGFCVRAGYPRINLWPDAAEWVRGTAESLPRITPTWNKRFLNLQNENRFHSSSALLAGIYILSPRLENESPSVIEPLNGKDALLSLLTHAHGRHIVERDMREREFQVLSKLVQQVPVCRAVASNRLASLTDFCKTMLTDFQNSHASEATTFREAQRA